MNYDHHLDHDETLGGGGRGGDKLHKIKRAEGQIAQPRYQTLIMKNQAGNIAIMRF